MIFPFLPTALGNLFRKPSTEKFPNPEDRGAKGYRGRIQFDADKCGNCGACIKVCAPMAITVEEEKVEGGTNYTRTFDLTSCTFCGYCADFCANKAITLTDDYHMVDEDHTKLRTVGTTFLKTIAGDLTCDTDNCIFCGLCAKNCPNNAITVDRETKTWKVDTEACVKCGICISKCPKKVLSFAEAKEGVINDASQCVYCTLCEKKCPVGAIKVDREAKTWEIDHDICIKCNACINNCPKKSLSMGIIK